MTNANFHSLFLRMLHIKFGFDWPSGSIFGHIHRHLVTDILAKITFLHKWGPTIKIQYLEKYYDWIQSISEVIKVFGKIPM